MTRSIHSDFGQCTRHIAHVCTVIVGAKSLPSGGRNVLGLSAGYMSTVLGNSAARWSRKTRTEGRRP